jgi:hypothetical protein
MITPLNAAADALVGSWLPQGEGIQFGCYFYPDGVFVMRNPRFKKFALQGVWALDESGSRLVISDVIDPRETLSEAERELIRSERHNIAIMKISRDSMVWKPDEAREKVEFLRAGGLPSKKPFWKRLLGL